MPIDKAFAYLIPAGKGLPSAPLISSKEIKLGSGKLSKMLQDIFGTTSGSHDFEISFSSSTTGAQQNDCRDLLIAFQQNPTIATGLPIAKRLQNATDNRSGIGLLFLLSGAHGLNKRLIVSRFPTDQAILADISSGGLNVEFLEQVFIKRLSSYKALTIEHPSPKTGYWKGIATDRQAGQSGEHISDYWLKDFLNADFSETPAAGTRRLARALKDAIKKNPSQSVKTEIAHASSMAASALSGKSIDIDGFCKHFGLSTAAGDTIKQQLSKPSLFNKKFKFDTREFKKVAPYRTVEMDTGAILTAPSEDFETIFKKTTIKNEVQYTTKGKISDQRLARA